MFIFLFPVEFGLSSSILMLAMVADFSKWKFNQWPFFPEKLNGSEGNGKKIGSLCSFLENGQHVEDLTNFTPTT